MPRKRRARGPPIYRHGAGSYTQGRLWTRIARIVKPTGAPVVPQLRVEVAIVIGGLAIGIGFFFLVLF